MRNKTEYLECKKFMNRFLKKDYWNSFASNNFFYIIDEKKEYLFTFVEQFYNDEFGCQLFFTPTGLNYVHDILTVESDNLVGPGDCDSICAILVPKEELKREEIFYLRLNNIRISKLNLILYRYEPGYAHRFANEKEISIFFETIEFLSSFIDNEYEDIVQAFKEELTAVAVVSKREMAYNVILQPLPILERKLRRQKVNESFVHEFEHNVYLNDDCYLFASYLPVIVRETKVRPISLYFYFPNSKKKCVKYMICNPKEYKNLIYGILYDVFTEIGVPLSIHFNHRFIYSLVEKTLTAMKIDSDFIRENRRVDGYVNDFLANIYKESPSEYIEETEVVEILMDSMAYIFNDIMDFEEPDDEPEIMEFVS